MAEGERMPIQNLSLDEFVGSNPRVMEHGEFGESTLAFYDPFFQGWNGNVLTVLQKGDANGWTYGVVNVLRWPKDSILLARRTGDTEWIVVGGYWRRGLFIRPEHRGKGLSYYLIKEAFRVQGGLRPPEERAYSIAGLNALKAAHKRASEDGD